MLSSVDLSSSVLVVCILNIEWFASQVLVYFCARLTLQQKDWLDCSLYFVHATIRTFVPSNLRIFEPSNLEGYKTRYKKSKSKPQHLLCDSSVHRLTVTCLTYQHMGHNGCNLRIISPLFWNKTNREDNLI